MDALRMFISRLYFMLYEQRRNNKLSCGRENAEIYQNISYKINQISSARKKKYICDATFKR